MTATPTPPALRLTTLGAVQLVATGPGGERRTLLGAGKPSALLAYLAAAPQRAASREALIDLLWSNAEPETARRNLRQTLFLLRRILGEDALESSNDDLRLAVPLLLDRDEFLEAVDAGDHRRAAALYTGPFFPAFAAPGGADFEHWADVERERLHGIHLRVLESLARAALHEHRSKEAAQLARQLVVADPAREASLRLLLEAMIASGEWLRAAAEADRIEATFRAEGRRPEPTTAALLLAARQNTEAGAPTAEAALVAELVGRESEFARLVEAWDAARGGAPVHVHVAGAPGIGKTRLLAEAAARLSALGARVVLVRARQGERSVPGAAAADLVRGLAALSGAVGMAPASADVLVGLDPGLSARFAGARAPAPAPEDLARLRGLALADLVSAVSEEQPLAVLLDDVHWADDQSRRLLAALSGRPQGRAFLLVTTARPTREPLSLGEPRLTLTLRPLAEGEVDALVESVASLPDTLRAAGLPHALFVVSEGVPMAVLETLRLALDRGWLVLADDTWTSPDPAALIAQLASGSALERRLEALSASERSVLTLLAAAEDDVAAPAVVAAATRLDVVAEPVLEALERRGFVAAAGERWAVAHDLVTERVLAAAEPSLLGEARRALGGALAARAADHPDDERAAVRQLGRVGDLEALRRLFAEHERRARRAGDRRPAPALARAFLGEEHARSAATLVAGLPPWRRWQLTAPRRLGVAAACVLVPLATWLVRDRVWARPDHLAIDQQPRHVDTYALDPPLLVEVVDRRGRVVTSAAESVTVSVPPGTPDLADAAPFRVPVRDGRADIREIPWLRTGDSTGLSALRLEYPALAPVTTRPLLLGFIGSRLWLVSAALNGQLLDESHRALEARRGGWVEGTITFRCTVSAGTASVLLVAVPTWGDRTRNFIALQAVLPDAYDAEITRRVRVPAPTSAGRYRLVFALAEETAGGYVASGTNWLVGAPRWRDGNDIADWSEEQIAQANREGRTRAQWLYLTGIGAELERSGGVSEASLARGRALAGRHYGRAVIPATAIDVVVR